MKRFANIKLTVFCLFWLGVLTFWGTVYQVDHGIYQAQHRFFDSVIFFGPLYLPLPGGMLTMAVLFVNLLASFFVHYTAGWKMPGLMLIHLGLMLLLLGGFFTRLTGIEAQMSLLPGEGSNLAEDLREWEFALLEEISTSREVRAIDFASLRKGSGFALDDSGLRFRVEELHANARALRVGEEIRAEDRPANASGIGILQPERPAKEPSENRPGLVLRVEGSRSVDLALFWGGETRFLALELPDGGVRFLRLRRKQHPLPLFLELVEFNRSYYPGSQIPRDYRSLITVHLGQDLERNAVIKMNEPFRHQGWTFYQQSFAVMDDSTEMSVFAVTRNYGRLVPYWGTGITSLGLALHFLQMQILHVRRRRKSA